MKKFEDYVDGENVTLLTSPGSIYKAYKSEFTHNAFRLKNDTGEVIADITEIKPVGNYEKSDRDLQPGVRNSDKYKATVDSDYDATGYLDIFDVQD